MRIRQKLNCNIFEDTSGVDILFGPDDELAEVVIDNMQRYVSGKFSIAPSSNENLSFGDVNSGRFVLILATSAFNLTLNGAAVPLACVPADALASTTVKFGGEMTLTSVNVANPSATVTLTGRWVIYGDPIP